MKPRLPSSKKWTEIPPELQKQMVSVFCNGFKGQLGSATVELEGRIYASELILSLGFRRPNQLKQPNFESLSLTTPNVTTSWVYSKSCLMR